VRVTQAEPVRRRVDSNAVPVRAAAAMTAAVSASVSGRQERARRDTKGASLKAVRP